MSDLPSSKQRSRTAAQQALTGEGAANDKQLALPLECPKCAHLAWVPLKELAKAARCLECGTAFGIGNDGQIHSNQRGHRACVRCPRCLDAIGLPARHSTAKVQCRTCHLEVDFAELFHKPEAPHRLHASKTSPTTPRRAAGSVNRLLLRGGLLLAFAACAAVIAVGIMMRMNAESPFVGLSRDFIQAASEGDTRKLSDFLIPQQMADFGRWHAQVLRPALIAAPNARPSELSVVVDRADESYTWTRVGLAGANRPAIMLAWCQESDGGWRIDASKMTDALAVPRRAPAPASREEELW